VIDRNAILVGCVVQVALLVIVGGTGTDFFRAVPWLGAVVLSGLSFFGGGMAGSLAGGSRRSRAIHGGLCGSFGGCIFAIWLYYTLVADVYRGAFYGLAYAIATIGIPPAFVVRYDTVLPVAFGVGGVLLYAVEGALAGAVVPPEWIDPPPVYPS
jgi:hypothetical protein